MQYDTAALSALQGPDHIFLTGDAGTGKTTLIRYFCEQNAGKVIILAPTGVAAVNAGGQTIHSFCQFPARPIGRDNVVTLNKDDPKHREKINIIRKAKYLIIDEISMVRADLMDQMYWFFEKNFGRPWAGLKLIMVGDLSQLPPVVTDKDRTMIKARYKSEFFFDANCWDSAMGAQFTTYRLTKIHRQSDPEFIKILNGIRNNSIMPWDLQDFSRKLSARAGEKLNPTDGIMVCTTNSIADHVNVEMMKRIEEPEEIFAGDLVGNFPLKDINIDKHLVLKPGCRVMIMRNDPAKQWHNGSIGTYLKMVDQGLLIDLDGYGKVSVPRYEFESIEYSYNSTEDKITSNPTGRFIQYPVRVAYAITIHKSQGKTFDKVIIDMGKGAFAHGQLYVALSRARSMEGIILRTPVQASDIIVNSRVKEFLSVGK